MCSILVKFSTLSCNDFTRSLFAFFASTSARSLIWFLIFAFNFDWSSFLLWCVFTVLFNDFVLTSNFVFKFFYISQKSSSFSVMVLLFSYYVLIPFVIWSLSLMNSVILGASYRILFLSSSNSYDSAFEFWNLLTCSLILTTSNNLSSISYI